MAETYATGLEIGELQSRLDLLPPDPARARAFAAFAETGLPHRRMEQWRWTDLRSAPRQSKIASHYGDPVGKLCSGVFFAPGAGLVPDPLPEGVSLLDSGDFRASPQQPMAALATALAANPLRLEIGVELKQPLYFRFDGDGSRFCHLEIILRAGASAHIIESHLAAENLCASAIYFTLEAGSRLKRSLFQAGSSTARQVIHTGFDAGAGAHFEQKTLACGAGRARLETHGLMSAPEASAILDAVYLAAPDHHIDLTSHICFAAHGGSASQTVRGLVASKGHGVFQGKFELTRKAQQTDASMHHAALLLADGAEVDARPELEIYADDVACAHGNAIGAQDEQAIFYMRQRGLDEKAARHLLARGFTAEVLDGIPEEQTRAAFTEETETWLTACL